MTGRVPNSASVDRLDARRRRLVVDAVAKLHSPIVGIDFEPGAIHEREHLLNIVLVKPRALGEISALVLASGAEQRAHAIRPEPVELVDRPQHVSRRPAFASPPRPIASITPSSTLRLLTLIT